MTPSSSPAPKYASYLSCAALDGITALSRRPVASTPIGSSRRLSAPLTARGHRGAALKSTHRKQARLAGDPFQCADAAVLERDSRTCDQVSDCARDENLASAAHLPTARPTTANR